MVLLRCYRCDYNRRGLIRNRGPPNHLPKQAVNHDSAHFAAQLYRGNLRGASLQYSALIFSWNYNQALYEFETGKDARHPGGSKWLHTTTHGARCSNS